MRRRDFIMLIGSAAAWPLAARAQQPPNLPVIGYLGASTPATESQWSAAFLQRLNELGWIAGQNVLLEYRWGEGRNERYAEIAAEFVKLKVDVIITSGTPTVVAAKQATSVIPIVFASVGNPVGTGLVASLARPGGNATGLSSQMSDTASKRVELLREIIPSLRRLAILGDIGNALSMLEMAEVQAAAHTLGMETTKVEIQRAEDIEPGITTLRSRVDALYVCLGPLMNSNSTRIGRKALSAQLPTMYGSKFFVAAGGLMSYGVNFPDQFRRAADYVDKILRGTKPGDLPVAQPVKFDLVINLGTAKALGLTIPPSLIARADEVIE